MVNFYKSISTSSSSVISWFTVIILYIYVHFVSFLWINIFPNINNADLCLYCPVLILRPIVNKISAWVARRGSNQALSISWHIPSQGLDRNDWSGYCGPMGIRVGTVGTGPTAGSGSGVRQWQPCPCWSHWEGRGCAGCSGPGLSHRY